MSPGTERRSFQHSLGAGEAAVTPSPERSQKSPAPGSLLPARRSLNKKLFITKEFPSPSLTGS